MKKFLLYLGILLSLSTYGQEKSKPITKKLVMPQKTVTKDDEPNVDDDDESDTDEGTSTGQIVATPKRNSIEQKKKPYVILISADGFRHDYAKKYEAKNLEKLSNSGVAAESLIPPFPSLTYPSHYTIVTGLYPAHHGIVGNRFYDPVYKQVYYYKDPKATKNKDWYFGTPLWVLAEEQQMLTACYYWVGSKAEIQGIRPTYRHIKHKKKGRTSIDERIAAIVNWLSLPAEERPHFITLYLSETDKAGHDYGPDSDETENAVEKVDKAIAKLTKEVNKLGLDNVNYIFVSDHGMTKIKPNKAIEIPKNIKKGLQSKFIIANEGAMVSLHAKERNFYKKTKDIKSIYEKLDNKKEDSYDVYLKKDVPAELHYSTKDDYFDRVGDIVLLARGKNYLRFLDKPEPPRKGQHGYDPKKIEDMKGVFYAWGPAFKNKKISAFESVHIYPIITSILGLKYNPKYIDGNESISQEILVNDKVNPEASEGLKLQSLTITSSNTILITDVLTASVTRSLTDGKGGGVIFSIQAGSGSAKVNRNTGLITSIHAGTVTLVAEAVGDDEYHGAKAYLPVTIKKITPILNISLPKTSMRVGEQIKATVTSTAPDGQGGAFTYGIETTPGEDEASVDNKGFVTAKSAGKIHLKVNSVGDENYNEASTTQEITINPIEDVNPPPAHTPPNHVPPTHTPHTAGSSAHFELKPPHPNPANDYVEINFSIPDSGPTYILLYNLSGQLVKEILHTELNQGPHHIRASVSDLHEGMYICRLIHGKNMSHSYSLKLWIAGGRN